MRGRQESGARSQESEAGSQYCPSPCRLVTSSPCHLVSLWPTQGRQDWVLITLTRQELERAERVRLALCRTLADYLEIGVTIGVRAGKLLVYLDVRGIADHRQASVAMLRVRAGLALYYGLDNPRHPLELAAALADDFAWRYIENEE